MKLYAYRSLKCQGMFIILKLSVNVCHQGTNIGRKLIKLSIVMNKIQCRQLTKHGLLLLKGFL